MVDVAKKPPTCIHWRALRKDKGRRRRGLDQSWILLHVRCRHGSRSTTVDISQSTPRGEWRLNSVECSRASDGVQENNAMFIHLVYSKVTTSLEMSNPARVLVAKLPRAFFERAEHPSHVTPKIASYKT